MTFQAKTYAPYMILAVLVFLPLLLPGYILTLDAVFVPHLAVPTVVSSDFLWRLVLFMANTVIPSQVIEKILFVSILFLSAVGMHRFVLWIERHVQDSRGLDWRWSPYLGGLFYAVNPFTYDRFMAGQYEVLLGYALIPFFVQGCLSLAEHPKIGTVVRLTILTVIMSIVSLPVIGECALVATIIFAGAVWQYRSQPHALVSYLRMTSLVVASFLVLTSYWLIPLLLGQGVTAHEVHSFTASDTTAFATVGSSFLPRLGSVLRLQGFWAEPDHLFVLPQAAFPGWGTVRLLIWALVASGAVICWRRFRSMAGALYVIGAISVFIAAGLLSGIMTRLGYREPQKLVGLLVFVFAVFIGFSTARITTWSRGYLGTAKEIALIGLSLIILIFTPTMYWGFAGQLQPREYPPGWFTVQRYLSQQTGSFRVVSLPWHEYMSFQFSQRIIANPAARFFGNNVVISNNPEIGGVRPPKDTLATQIGNLVSLNRRPPDLPVELARYNVRFIMLAKDFDYEHYQSLVNQPGIVLVQSTPSINLYAITTWREGEVHAN